MGTVRTTDDWGALVARVALASVMLPHGAEKAFGWFGGQGLQATISGMTEQGLPVVVPVFVVLAELLGSAALLVGLFGRLAAASIGAVMLGAVALVHFEHGLFMNWSGKQAGEGFEYHLLAIAIAVALMLKGGGRWSLDGLIARRR